MTYYGCSTMSSGRQVFLNQGSSGPAIYRTERRATPPTLPATPGWFRPGSTTPTPGAPTPTPGATPTPAPTAAPTPSPTPFCAPPVANFTVDPTTGQVAHTYLALDQAMTLVALANYLHPHVIPDLFATAPIVQRAVAVLGDESFFE